MQSGGPFGLLDGVFHCFFGHDVHNSSISPARNFGFIRRGFFITLTDNLAAWLGIATNVDGAGWNSTNVTESATNNPAAVTVFDTAPAATNRFLRLRVTRP